MDKPSGIPVMLDVLGRRCVIVGGGGVALRRARSLLDAGAEVIVVAPDVDPGLLALEQQGQAITIHQRGFEPRDMDQAFLAVIATDVDRVNTGADWAARERGVLINRADVGEQSNITFMATHRQGPLTLAVHTGGASANAAKQIRDALVDHLDPDWQTLLQYAQDSRDSFLNIVDPAQRRKALLSMVNETAMNTLKAKGADALRAYYADLMKQVWEKDHGSTPPPGDDGSAGKNPSA